MKMQPAQRPGAGAGFGAAFWSEHSECKLLLGIADPLLLAGLLYLGSGLGLALAEVAACMCGPGPVWHLSFAARLAADVVVRCASAESAPGVWCR